MADTENTPQFFMFTTRKKGEREKRFENLKKRFTMAQIMQLLGNDFEDSEYNESTIAALIEGRIISESMALEEAESIYAEKYKQKRKDDREKGLFDDYFAALDDWNENKEKYEEYEKKQAEIEKKHRDEISKLLSATDTTQENIKTEDKKYQTEILRLNTEYDSQIKSEKKYREEHNKYAENSEIINELSFFVTNNKDGKSEGFFNASLIKTYKDIQKTKNDEEKNKLSKEFDQIFKEYLNDEHFNPRTDENGKKINEHRFSIETKKDGQKYIRHTITNLDNTGLNLAMLADGIDITHHTDPMTEAQLKALAQYCYHHNLDIKDFLKLRDVNVEDELGNPIGTVPAQFAEKTKELEANGGEYKKENNIKINEEEHARVKSDVLKDNEIVSFGAYDPNEPSPKDAVGVRSKMVDKAIARLGIIGYPNPALMNVSHGMNSTIISVYNNENDKLVDGQTDKDGKRQHTKAFAVELLPTTPPSAKFYIPATKDFNDKHARVILESFKACGSEYFTIPNANEIGGPAFGHFMTAAGKALMVPMCKRGKNQPGVDLDNDHIAAILEVIKKENKFDADKVIQFKQKLLRELEAQENGRKKENEKYKTNSTLATTMATIEGDIKFGKFQSSYKDALQEFVNNGINNGYGNPPKKWDELDRAAACFAMGEIVRQLAEGSLDGKKFDPFDKDGKNLFLLKKELAKQMAKKKPDIVKNILHLNGKDKDFEQDSETGAIIRADKHAITKYLKSIEGTMTSETSAVCSRFGIEKMDIRFTSAEGYELNNYTNGKIPPTQFGNEALDNAHNNSTKEERSFDITQDSREKQEKREYDEARRKAKESGHNLSIENWREYNKDKEKGEEQGKKLSLEDWLKQKAREQAARAAQNGGR